MKFLKSAAAGLGRTLDSMFTHVDDESKELEPYISSSVLRDIETFHTSLSELIASQTEDAFEQVNHKGRWAMAMSLPELMVFGKHPAYEQLHKDLVQATEVISTLEPQTAYHVQAAINMDRRARILDALLQGNRDLVRQIYDEAFEEQESSDQQQ